MTEHQIDPGTVVLTALGELRGIADDAWIEGPLLDRVIRLDRAKVLVELLTARIHDIEQSLVDSMEEDEFAVPGIGKVVRERKTSSSWRNEHASQQMREDLASAVAAVVALDVATGEMDPMKRNVALAAVRTIYEAIPAFSSLKAAGRARLGLKMSDYRSYSDYYAVTLDRGIAP